MAPGRKDPVRNAFNDIHVGVDFWEPIDYSLIKVSSGVTPATEQLPLEPRPDPCAGTEACPSLTAS